MLLWVEEHLLRVKHEKISISILSNARRQRSLEKEKSKE
jgi:hypothetical protein